MAKFTTTNIKKNAHLQENLTDQCWEMASAPIIKKKFKEGTILTHFSHWSDGVSTYCIIYNWTPTTARQLACIS